MKHGGISGLSVSWVWVTLQSVWCAYVAMDLALVPEVDDNKKEEKG